MFQALSRFPLSHEEVVERRRQLSGKGSPDRNGKSVGQPCLAADFFFVKRVPFLSDLQCWPRVVHGSSVHRTPTMGSYERNA